MSQQPQAPNNYVLNIVPRWKWGAAPALWQKNLEYPIEYIFFTTTNTFHCFDHNSCHKEMVFIQNRDKTTKNVETPDIRYNFLIGDNGRIYEGRGWDCRPTLPKRYGRFNSKALFIALIGHFKNFPPSEQVYQTRKGLIRFGMNHALIRNPYLEFHLRNMNKAQVPYG